MYCVMRVGHCIHTRDLSRFDPKRQRYAMLKGVT